MGVPLSAPPTEWGVRLYVSLGCAWLPLADGTERYRGVYIHPRALYTNQTPILIYSLAKVILGGKQKCLTTYMKPNIHLAPFAVDSSSRLAGQQLCRSATPVSTMAVSMAGMIGATSTLSLKQPNLYKGLRYRVIRE